MIDRRTMLTGSAAVAVTTTLGIDVANASKPQGIHVAGFKITSFSDGHLSLPEKMFAPGIEDAARAAALKSAGQQGATIVSPLNVTLIEAPGEKILVDVGSGPRFMDSAGKLVDGLEAAGIDPEKITKVIYTHAHPDHLWGTVNDFDELNFPNATYYISEAEWNFWMSKDVLTKLPNERHGFAIGAQRNLNAAKSQLKTIKPGGELVAGLHVLATPGHTPGHISIEVGSGKEAVVVLGDALTHPVISFQHPDWRPATDQNPDLAVKTRRRLLDKLAVDGNRIIGYHLPVPGMGRVQRKSSGFVFAPFD